MALGDLDEVAEDVVELDLEGVDPGALALGFLELRDPLLAIAGGGAEVVELGAETVADEAAVLGGDGRFVDQGPLKQIDQSRELVELFEDVGLEMGGPGEGLEVGAERRDLGEGGLEGLQVARVAGSLGEAAGAALDVADVPEALPAFGEEVGLGQERLDEVVARFEGLLVRDGMQDPVAQLAGPHRGGGAVEDPEEGVLPPRAGLHEVEVLLRGGVDRDLLANLAHREAAEVIAGTAELVGEVVQDTARGAEGGMHSGTAEAVEGLHLEVVAQGVDGLIEQKGVAVVGQGMAQAAEFLELFVGNEEFGRGEAGQLVFELLAVGKLRDRELAGGVIDHRQAEATAVHAHRGEVIVAAVVEEGEVVDGAGRDDLADLALHDLAGDRLGGLLRDGDSPAGLDEFRNVVLGGVMGDPAHGDAAALGEGHVEKAGRFPGVLEEHLVEIPEPEEEEDVGGKGAAHRLILRHHGSELAFLGAGHGGDLEGGRSG